MSVEFERYLDQTLGEPVERLAKTARRAATVAGRLPAAAERGDMRAVEAALRELDSLEVHEPVAAARSASGSFDYRVYLESGWAADFQAACRDAGVPLEGYFPNYTVFPFPVRVDTETLSVLVNRTRVGTLRPSALVRTIQSERDRLERSPFNVDEFLGVLFRIWERLNQERNEGKALRLRQPVSLKKVYQELRPFRRWRRDYPETFFAFDVQRLLSSGVVEHNGHHCGLERGRGGSAALRMVDRQGQERLIETVHFVER